MKKTADMRTSKQRISLKNIVIVLIGLLVLFIVLPQIGSFRSSFAVLKHANFFWLSSAIVVSGVSYVAAALVYRCLAQKPLPFLRTVLVQLASMFTNRLLPAGIGAIGTNYRFLYRQKHTSAQALTIVTVNNLLGFIGNILLVGIMLLISPAGLNNLHIPQVSEGVLTMVAAVVLIAITVLFVTFRARFSRFVSQIRTALAHYRQRPFRLLAALASSMLLTLCYTACLYAAGQAVGIHLSIAAVLLCMTAGVAGSTVVPTPGGLGGAEAGLVAGLSAYGIAGSQALAAVLLYRLCTYWLALMAGGIAFIVVSRRRYI